ncbi:MULTISPECIES: hypothetical protein [Bacillus subtilis group]|uniref:hypothetical protein n=1 Tax=Bacillus subtilis group TaxID=653685 RepID=UPI001B0DE819|nr:MULTISPECIES: hypothetical protein [Bacillus subtilis group]MED4337867.1 hypothetical protein [Bacillus licheniformis]MED4371129.1 hypothetical protein [Bacillus licheniformis]GIN55043.1 hypothetical protein J36TS2_39370 [Bacillus paralicheniformis]
MSYNYNESKTVLRAEIPHLKGVDTTEAYKYFKRLLGEADDFDEWEDENEIDYFVYEALFHKYVPVASYGDGDMIIWGIDCILAYKDDHGNCKGKDIYSLAELKSYAEEMAKKFDVNPDKVKLLSYTWYNGVEEPIRFE